MSSPQLFLRELDPRERGHLARSYKITSTRKPIDDALEEVEIHLDVVDVQKVPVDSPVVDLWVKRLLWFQ